MKKTVVMIMAGIMLVAMVACGKDAGVNQPQSDQTADEALEMLNAEINAMIEAEQREAEREEEERAQRLEEGYPEGIFPAAGYICRDLLDEGSDIFIDKQVCGVFHVGVSVQHIYDTDTDTKIYYSANEDRSAFNYIYDTDTKIYTIFYYKTDGFGGGDPWSHHFEGYLNDEGDFVVTYYARYDDDILYETVGTITRENMFERFEEEHPEVAEVVKDDIEWVYVIYE